MLRMIRSARSRISRDFAADEASASYLGQDDVVAYCNEGARAVAGVGTAGARPGRAGMARSRSASGSGHQLLPGGVVSDNVRALPHATSATVLGDVTNTSGQPWTTWKRAAEPLAGAGATCVKKPAGIGVGVAANGVAPASLVAQMATPSGIGRSASSAAGRPSAVPSLSPTPMEVESDVLNKEDPQHVVEYVQDVYKRMHADEGDYLPQPSFLDWQTHVNSKMRAILVDWLVDVHKKYKLRPETLFLAVGLTDRFLEKRTTARRHLQLLGVTALLVAGKLEEQYPLTIQDTVYVTDRAYTKDEVIQMEVSILTLLDFKVCRPTAVHFLDRYQIVNGCKEEHRDLANYLLELTLVEHKMVKYSPSQLAAAAMLLSNKLLRRQPSWPSVVAKHTRCTEQSLKECAKEMCGLLEQAEQNPLQAIRKKYSQPRHHEIAKSRYITAVAGLAADAAQARPPRRASVASVASSGGHGRRASVGGQQDDHHGRGAADAPMI